MPNLLKRLELNGFKSFAQKTSFDLSNGITAIVGPNGSGKSNVIDAIRWLLGERDAKNLRGGKSEDLIFAGTAKRARVGQAQASLHFENKNNFFPVEFPEITISRQVDRDGNNRYFLNKAEVRLKDVIDFFAKARVGARGLIVVTQGNSDMFIQANPSVRREMIEEMLGLREYQLKRAESERRLKNTQINLDRAKALIDEILPHLRSLKRQTSRWEKREVLEQELRGLESAFFGTEIHEIKEKLSEVQKDLANREKEYDILEKEKHTAEAHLKSVESNEPLERRELQEIKKETQGLLDKRGKIQKELGRFEAQLELGGKNSSSGSLPSVQLVLDFVKKIRNKLEALVDIDYEDMQHSLQEIVEDIDDLLQAPVTSGNRVLNSGIEKEFETLSKEFAELEHDLRSLQDREKTLEKNQEQFYAAFKAAVAGVETAKDKIEIWERANQEYLFLRQRLEMRREEWERQVRTAGHLPEDFMNVKLAEAMDDRTTTERRIFKLRGDLASIGEIDEALLKEARETEARYEFLNHESEDLEKAKAGLRKLIVELQTKIKTEFGAALHKINDEFHKFFNLMFGGGQAKLKLFSPKAVVADAKERLQEGEVVNAVLEDEEIEEGIEIDLKLPKKRITSIDMLSGGERSLVGIAALFALVSVSPPPFLVLDEVDAALDEQNARRFSGMLKEFSKETQFVLVTHNRVTMEAADMLYGVTMNEDATSKVVALKLEPQTA